MSQDRGLSSPAAPATAIWTLTAIAFALAVTRLEEMVSPPVFFLLLALVFAAAPLALLAWAFSLRRTKRRHALAVGAGVLVTSLCLLAGARWLMGMSARINFEMHRAAYEAVAAEYMQARLAGRADSAGLVRGVSHGVRFVYDPRKPGKLEFPWTVNPVFEDGVTFDAQPCGPYPCRDTLAAHYRRSLRGD